jgi:CBS domain containing-hemolysin-like protein
MLMSILAYAAGFLLLFLSSGIRSCMPDMIITQGRDPSERRQAAFFHLGILWLMNFAGIVLAGGGSILLAGLLGPEVGLPLWASFLVLVTLAFLIAVMLPSVIAMKNSPRFLAVLRLPYFLVSLLFRLPALLLFGGNSEENPETVGWLITPPDVIWLERRREKGDPGEFEKEQELMDSIIDFSDKIVREVMVPRIDMVCVEINADLSTVVERLKKAGHSRIPVYEEKIDNIRGLLYAKDLLALLSDSESGFQIRNILRDPYFVPEYKRIDELMREFQSKRIHMAIVVDEYGGTAGLVTLEDIMEEVFGEILDEYDKEALLVKKLEGDSYILDARLPIDDLNSLLGTDFADDDFESLGGMVYQLMGKIPRPNERTEFSGYSFTVEQVRAQRILYVRVEPVSGPVKETD